MKSVYQGIFVFASVIIFYGCTGAPEQREGIFLTKAVDHSKKEPDKRIADFLTFAAENRIMNITRGELAKRKSSSQDLQEYGALLIEDQTKLLQEIKVLINANQIVLPQFIDLAFNEELTALSKKDRKAFDSSFIKKMISNHLRDVEEFRKAIEFDDPQVRIFAIRNLPMLEKHLRQLEDLEARHQ